MQNDNIIFEDDVLLVLNKPAGIIVNKSDTTIHEVTIQDWTEKHLHIDELSTDQKTALEIIDENGYKNAFYDRGGIAHRLDKETSGILLVAKNPQAFANLQKQFKERVVTKTYLALVHGTLSPDEGEVSVPVDRLPWNRKRFGIIPGGRPSTTFYKTKQIYTTKGKHPEKMALVELSPKTGRTHQIRVHMKYLNHPIVSDFLYAGRKTSRDDRALLDRVFLHAAKISFTHPQTGETLEYEAKLPAELQQYIDEYLSEI